MHIWNTYSLKLTELYFCAYFELEPIFSSPCWHHIYGGKMHEDRQANFNPGRLRSGLILIHYHIFHIFIVIVIVT